MNAFDVFRRQRKFALQSAALHTSIARYETVLPPVPCHGFDAVPDVHLLADVIDVGAHGFKAYAQLIADLRVEVAGG